jgi:hypothetical protein
VHCAKQGTHQLQQRTSRILPKTEHCRRLLRFDQIVQRYPVIDKSIDNYTINHFHRKVRTYKSSSDAIYMMHYNCNYATLTTEGSNPFFNNTFLINFIRSGFDSTLSLKISDNSSLLTSPEPSASAISKNFLSCCI